VKALIRKLQWIWTFAITGVFFLYSILFLHDLPIYRKPQNVWQKIQDSRVNSLIKRLFILKKKELKAPDALKIKMNNWFQPFMP